MGIPWPHQLALGDVPTVPPPHEAPEQRPKKDMVGTQIANPPSPTGLLDQRGLPDGLCP